MNPNSFQNSVSWVGPMVFVWTALVAGSAAGDSLRFICGWHKQWSIFGWLNVRGRLLRH